MTSNYPDIGDTIIISNPLHKLAFVMGKIISKNADACYIQTDCDEIIRCEMRQVTPVAYAEIQISRTIAFQHKSVTFDNNSHATAIFAMNNGSPTLTHLFDNNQAELTLLLRDKNGIRHLFTDYQNQLYVLDIQTNSP